MSILVIEQRYRRRGCKWKAEVQFNMVSSYPDTPRGKEHINTDINIAREVSPKYEYRITTYVAK